MGPHRRRRVESAGDLRELMSRIGNCAEQAGLIAYAVGGCVRKLVTGSLPPDLDLVVLDPTGGIDLAWRLHRELRFRRPVIFERFGTAQTVGWGIPVELVPPRVAAEDWSAGHDAVLHKDLLLRDFTVNTLVQGLHDDARPEDRLDMGFEDLRRRRLRTPIDPRATLNDDPLRMLRAIRFHAEEGFVLEQRLREAIPTFSGLLAHVARERVRDEVQKILLSPRPEALTELQALNLVHHVSPLLNEASFEEPVLGWIAALPASLVVRFAAWLSPSATDARRGEVERALRELKLSNREIRAITMLIRATGAEVEDFVPRWRGLKWARQQGELLPEAVDLLQQLHADEEEWHGPLQLLASDEAAWAAQVELPLNGHEIQRVCDLEPGPEIRRWKERLLDAVLKAEVAAGDAEGARVWLRQRVRSEESDREL